MPYRRQGSRPCPWRYHRRQHQCLPRSRSLWNCGHPALPLTYPDISHRRNLPMKLHGLAVAAIFAAGCAFAQTTEIHNDIPASFTPPKQQAETVTKPEWDYTKRVEMVPMRDGTKLYTVIVIPKGAKNAPMILTRTP